MNTENVKANTEPTYVGRIALERQAGRKTFDTAVIGTTDLPIHNKMHWPLGYQALTFAML